MYELDFTTCTMSAVIGRSATCHPSLFRENMLQVAKVHSDYSAVARDTTAARIALDMSSNLRRMADEIDMHDFDALSLSPDELTQAFAVACKLQCIGPVSRDHIARRGR